MLTIRFYENVDESLLKYAVIVAKYRGRWVLCKHKERVTLECPGGHREKGETIDDAAKRELYEETGAAEFRIRRVCVYSVNGSEGVVQNKAETFGMLYYAEISEFGPLPGEFEMERLEFMDSLSGINWTYPGIQPALVRQVIGVGAPETF